MNFAHHYSITQIFGHSRIRIEYFTGLSLETDYVSVTQSVSQSVIRAVQGIARVEVTSLIRTLTEPTQSRRTNANP
jgi:hypothetical protein